MGFATLPIGAVGLGAVTNVSTNLALKIVKREQTSIGEIAVDAIIGAVSGKIASVLLDKLLPPVALKESLQNFVTEGIFGQTRRLLARGSAFGLVNIGQGIATRAADNILFKVPGVPSDQILDPGNILGDFVIGFAVTGLIDVAGKALGIPLQQYQLSAATNRENQVISAISKLTTGPAGVVSSTNTIGPFIEPIQPFADFKNAIRREFRPLVEQGRNQIYDFLYRLNHGFNTR